MMIVMDTDKLELLLKGTKYEAFSRFISPVELKGHKYNNVYKIGNETLGYFALKISENNEKPTLDTTCYTSPINDSEGFMHRYEDAIVKSGVKIMVSKWLNGVQPIDNGREHLPNFFSSLARLNKQNIAKGPYTSMYADGNYFDTASDLVNWEINYHKKYLQDMPEIDEVANDEIVNAARIIERGLPCIILEDMNTGNLIVTDDGKCKFLDTEWIMNGVNLYQFEKIDYFGFEERKWYNVNDEAQDCYTAYFEALGVKQGEANEQIRAFELLKVLRENTYLKYLGKCNNEEIARRLKIVMRKHDYV